MTGPHSNDSNLRADGPDAARDPHGEPLSALMDGTLSDDESRFLLRRMQHDAELAGRWERWQFYGDAMRGCAGRALPADFNRRIALAIAAESEASSAHHDMALDAVAGDPRSRALPPSAVAARRPLLRWGGGAALAASVAFAAIVGLRPDTSVVPDAGSSVGGAALVGAASPDSAADTPAAPASATSAAAVAAATADDQAPAAGQADALQADALQADAIVASSPSSPATPVSATAAPSALASRSQGAAAERRTATAPTRVIAADSIDAGAAPRVPDLRAGFASDAADDEVPLIAKPWPRSPLLQGRIEDGVMVDYGQGGDGRGLILGRPAQPPRSGSPLAAPSIFVAPSGASAPAQQPAAVPATGSDAEPAGTDDTPRQMR